MASSNRDLTIALIAKADRFDLTEPTRDLEKLGDAGKDAGRDVEQGSRDAERALSKIDDAAKDTGREFDKTRDDLNKFLDRLGGMRAESRRADDSLDRVKGGLRDVGQEAQDTSREMFASFSGSFDDIGDAAQELLANAGSLFGPAGLAIGGALAAGASVWFNAYNERAEKLKEMASDFTDALIENNGQLSEAFIAQAVQDLGTEELTRLGELARQAGVDVGDLARAKAGDVLATARVQKALDDSEASWARTHEGMSAVALAADPVRQGQEKIRDELGFTGEALSQGMTGYQVYREAISQPTEVNVDTQPARDELKGFEGASIETKRRVVKALGEPVHVPVVLDAPTQARANAIRAEMQRRFGTIIVDVEPNVRWGGRRFLP